MKAQRGIAATTIAANARFHRSAALLVALLPLATSSAAFSFFAGYVPVGDDALTPPLPAGTTAAAAQAWCAADAACVAVTFEGPRDGPSAGAVYAKTAAGMAAFVANETGGWSTWARADPAAVWHVVWTGGQSNSVGTNSQTTGYPTWPTTTRMYPRQKTRPQPLTHPPTHPSS